MSDTDKRNAARIAAVKTLERLGYTYEGGVEWKPPLAKQRDHFDALLNGTQVLQYALRSMGPGIELQEIVVAADRLHDLSMAIHTSTSFMMIFRHMAHLPMPIEDFMLMGVRIRGVVK
jgi:hypothetical protein